MHTRIPSLLAADRVSVGYGGSAVTAGPFISREAFHRRVLRVLALLHFGATPLESSARTSRQVLARLSSSWPTSSGPQPPMLPTDRRKQRYGLLGLAEQSGHLYTYKYQKAFWAAPQSHAKPPNKGLP